MTFHQNLPKLDDAEYQTALDKVRQIVRDLGSVPECGATQFEWVTGDLVTAVRKLDRLAWAGLNELADDYHAEDPPLGVVGERVRILNRSDVAEHVRGLEATITTSRHNSANIVKLDVDGHGQLGFFRLTTLARVEPLFEVLDEEDEDDFEEEDDPTYLAAAYADEASNPL
jgi:hypothetical protein